MTLVLERPSRSTHGNLDWPHFRRRLYAILRLWARRRARSRFAAQVLAETDDPRALADVGVQLPRQRDLERWAAMTLYHRR